jgi:hypothetical protein
MFSYATKSDGVQPSAPTNDANFNQVSILLHGDGTNGTQNNTFLDSSTNNFTVTRNGTPTQGTYTPYSQDAGYWSNYLNGSSYLTVPANAAFAFGTGDFTVESFIYFNVAPSATAQTFLDCASAGQFGFQVTNTAIVAFSSFGAAYSFTQSLVISTWYHIAFCRVGTTLTCYVNGVSIGTNTVSFSFTSPNTVNIGRNANNTQFVNCYLSNLRLVKGTAVYTANFTPLTAPLTAITNTSLLTCQSNRFKDNSSNNFTITRAGTPSVRPWSAFLPTSSYSTSVNGGSMYFPGTNNNNLTIAQTTTLDLPADFTIEAWVYPQITAEQGIAGKWSASVGAVAYVFDIDPINNRLRFGAGNSGTFVATYNFATTSIPINTWHYAAITRSGSSVRAFLNGIQIGSTTTVTSNLTASTTCFVGTVHGTASPMNGYISNLRIVKGTALYISNFTPPTAPLTAITNTVLLLNSINAGIVDNAIKSDSITVGATQIDTSVVKYGTGSISFNGTTSVLDFPNNTYYAFNTGNFTIESWVYPNSVTILQSLIDTRSTATATTGILVSITALGFISVTVNNAILFTSSTGITISAWTHVAVVKSGTTITLYLNGTKPLTGSGTSATSLTDQFLRLGASAGTAAQFFNGYLDEVRITNGVARYLADFTPPAQAFPNQ